MSGTLYRSSELSEAGEWDGEGGKQDNMEVRLKLTSRHKQVEDLGQRLQKPKMLGKHGELRKACLGKRRPKEKKKGEVILNNSEKQPDLPSRMPVAQ